MGSLGKFGLAILADVLLCAASAQAAGTTLGGQPVRPGKTLDYQFAVEPYFQEYASAGGNPRPDRGHALLMFPRGFTPTKPWPILVVTSTTDAHRTSPEDAWWYRQPANAEGWLVIATDATIHPTQDSTMWRMGLLGAALQSIRHEWPQSTQWPMAFGGLSGGAKRSGILAAMLAKSGTINLCGIFLAGDNDDRISPAFHDYSPPSSFLRVPIWLSNGLSDPIATPALTEHVRASLVSHGFTNVRVEPFDGRHELKAAELQRALRWFRQVGKF